MLKLQCGCGHKIAVPDQFSGKRIKCPRCQAPLQVGAASVASAPAAIGLRGRGAPPPRGMAPPMRPAAASTQVPTQDDIRHARMKRQARENKRKSHNTTVAIIAGAMVLIGLGALLVVGIMNRPEPVTIADTQPQTAGGDEAANASGLKPINTRRGPDGTLATGDDGMVAGRGDVGTIATTSTFDGGTGLTTVRSQPSPLSVAGKTLSLTLKFMYDGKDLKQATQLSAMVRLKGDFTDLVSGAATDEPQLTLEIDDKEYDYKPTAQFGGEERKGENAREKLPDEVEYTLDRTTLLALARGATVKSRLGAMEFGFSDDQMALFRGFDPSPRPVAAPETPEKPAPAAGGAEKPAVKNDAGDGNEKEMEKEEMKKK
jgi:hypothetical protein